MPDKLLLTSFQTWLPHQTSNSSDDLLQIVQLQRLYANSLLFLRNLPVNIELAAKEVLKTAKGTNPQAIVCCGMSESSQHLTIESNATYRESCIFTRVNLNHLANCLTDTTISDDAGKFVCEGLYYQVLKYCEAHCPDTACLFVHVPLLNDENQDLIQHDFVEIIRFLLTVDPISHKHS